MAAARHRALMFVACVAGGCDYSAPITPDAQEEPVLPTIEFAQGATNADESSGTLAVEVVLSEPATSPVTVEYVLTGGSAEITSDFEIQGGMLELAPGETEQSFQVTIAADLDEMEMTETIVLGLRSPTGARLGSSISHTITIADRLLPRVNFEMARTSTDEATPSMIAVTLSAPSQGTSTVELVLAGTATQGEDFALANNTVITFEDKDEVVMIAVGEIDDDLDEDDPETLDLTLQNASANLILGPQAAAVHEIADDDDLPTVGFALASDSRAESAGTVNVVLSLSAVSGRDVQVPYVLGTSSSAAVPADATLNPAAPATITIPAGSMMAVIAVTIADDQLDEANERIILGLATPVNAELGTATHQLTITDDDDPPEISFMASGATHAEDAGTVNAFVVLSAPSGRTITAPFTLGGATTATDPDDYSLAPTTNQLVFMPGTTMLPIAITIAQDTLDEPSELVVLNLGNAGEATEVAPTAFTLTITDDDDPSVVQFDPTETDQTVDEGDSGTTTFDYELVLDKASGFEITVPLTITGDATDPFDYTMTSPNPIVFAPGETSQLVTIVVNGDNDNGGNDAGNDQVIMTIDAAGVVNAAVGSTAERIHVIRNDD